MLSQALALEVNGVRVGQHTDKTRIVIDVDAPANFKTFTLENPSRLVIDMPKFDWQANNTIQQEKKSLVASVRHGNLDSDTSRIVFDMKDNVNIIKSFSLEGGAKKSNRIVIDVRAAGAEEIAENKTPAPVKPAPVRPQQKRIIVIDPGHGGKDPGAVRGKIYEKNVVLQISKKLKAKLEASGEYKVYLTRSDDRFIKLYERVKYARAKKADLFISMHADSLPKKSSIRGASIYTLSETASDAQTARLAARENKADLISGIDLTHEDKDVANILLDLVQRDTLNQANFFAESLVKAFKNSNIRTLENPHRSAGFAVLKAPDIPSILVEAGFLSNRHDAKLLTQKDHQLKIANTIAKGVEQYLSTH